MMDRRKEQRRALRLERKFQKLGLSNPVCADCHTRDICVLVRVNDRTALSIVLCRNCRRKRRQLSQKQLSRRLKDFINAGFPVPTCSICSEPDIRCLDLDHLAGKANCFFRRPLCRNCHARKCDIEEDLLGDLRRRDADRSALSRQAACEIGVAMFLFALTVLGAVRGSIPMDSTKLFTFIVIALVLLLWAVWDLDADRHLTARLGKGWDKAVPAPAPP